MTYFLILLIIAIIVGFLMYRFWVKNNWRKAATILATVYKNYSEQFDKKEAFIKTLEFNYKPPKVIDLLTKEEKDKILTFKLWRGALARKNRKLPVLVDRYLSLLSILGLEEVIDKYFKEDMRILSHPSSEGVRKFLSPDKFTFERDNFTLEELVYCALAIEHPRVVAHIPKQNASNIIKNFLELSENTIRAHAEDPSLIQEMDRVDNV